MSSVDVSTYALNNITQLSNMDEASMAPSPCSNNPIQPMLVDEVSVLSSPMLDDATQLSLTDDASTIHIPTLNSGRQWSLTDEAAMIPTTTLDNVAQSRLMEGIPLALFSEQGDEHGVPAPAAFDTKPPTDDFQLVWTPPDSGLYAC